MKRQKNLGYKSATLHERELQWLVHSYLQKGCGRFTTVSGNIIQVVSPGRINPYEGPDFLRMAIIINGIVHIGNGEFHRRSSDWVKHHHHHDSRYAEMLIHIVLNNDLSNSFAKETLVVDETLFEQESESQIMNTLTEDLQNYALQRLLRKTSDAIALYAKHNEYSSVLKILINTYLSKRIKRRLRPNAQLSESDIASLFIEDTVICDLIHGHEFSILIGQKLLSIVIPGIGKHLQQELCVNCLLPVLLSNHLRNDSTQIMMWYWSARAMTNYSYIQRMFPDNPQDYIWQQQGMLEFIHREHHQGILCLESSTKYTAERLITMMSTKPE